MPISRPQPVIPPGAEWIWLFGKKVPLPLTEAQKKEIDDWLTSVGNEGMAWSVNPEAHDWEIHPPGHGILHFLKWLGEKVYDYLDDSAKKIWDNLTDGAKRVLSNLKDPVKIAAAVALVASGNWAAAIAVIVSSSPPGGISAEEAQGLSELTGGEMSPEQIKNYVKLLNDPVGFIADAAGPAINSLAADVKTAIDQQTATANETLNQTQQDVSQQLNAKVTSSLDQLAGYQEGTLNTLNNVFTGVANLTGYLTDKVLQNLSTAATAGIGVVTNLTSTLQNYFEAAIGGIRDTLAGIGTGIQDSLKASVSALAGVGVAVEDALQSSIQPVLTGIAHLTGDLEGAIRDTITSVTAGASGIADALTSPIDAVSRAVESLTGGLKGAIAEGGAEALTALFDRFVASFGDGAAKPTAFSEPSHSRLFDVIKGAIPLSAEEEGYISGIFAGIGNADFFWRIVLTGLIAVYTIVPGVQGIAAYQSDLTIREFKANDPHTLLPIPDAIQMYYKGLLPIETAEQTIRENGYSSDQAQALINAAQNVTDPTYAAVWFLRGLLGQDEFEARLRAQGWIEKDIQSFVAAIYFIPGPSDLVQMAVKEAFTPAIAEQFGQFDDFPEPFAEWAAKQGMSREWAERYWAAHWSLPSATMGFEMFHRAIIDRDQLSVLLRALDVMPFWRDKLIQLAYAPLTRVDIRRMYGAGVIDKEQVLRATLDLGYSPENAQRLTDFTVKLYDKAGKSDATDAHDLTRTDILRYLQDGTITDDEARSMLTALGYDTDAVALYIQHVHFLQDQDARQAALNLILARAKAGLISFDDAQNALGALDVSTAERDAAVAKLVQDNATHTELPTRTDLDRMLKAKVIDDTVYRTTMERRGYSVEWTERYLTLAKEA